MTNFVDAESRELLFMVEGRKAGAFAAFAEALQAHGGDPKQIELISMDMSPAYRAGAEEFFPVGAHRLRPLSSYADGRPSP